MKQFIISKKVVIGYEKIDLFYMLRLLIYYFINTKMTNIINKLFNSLRNPIFRCPSNMMILPLFSRNSNLESIIKVVTVNRTAGVNILFLPPNTGKTLSTFCAMKSLHEHNKIGHCIIMNCSHFSLSLRDEVRNNIWKRINIINNEHPTPFTFSELFSDTTKRAVIVFDQFESIYDNNNHQEIEAMILCMAHNANRTNTYTVQININDDQKYRDLLKLNGGQKLLPFFEYNTIKSKSVIPAVL